jgi:dienelactone hydrolase
MRFTWLSMLLLTGVCFAAGEPRFATKDGVFHDPLRSRDVPYRIYYPQPLSARYPVVVVSHGLGGSRENNARLGAQLAVNGYVAVHIEHAGSDGDVAKGKMDRRAALAAAARQRMAAVQRFADVPFAVREISRLNEQDALFKDHLDLAALGMAGHSYGAISTQIAAGQRVGEQYRSAKVRELRAGLLLSPSPPDDGVDLAQAYADIDIPLFHMTGTKDKSPAFLTDRDVSPSDRVKPYEKFSIQNQYLLVLDAADHMTFSGARIGTRDEMGNDKEHMTAVLTGATLFFNAYLKNDEASKAKLRNDFKGSLSNKDRFEYK